jgi:hypothetical protein
MTKQLWQFSESPQRLNDIAREVVSLRRENRFLKVGLVFCLVLSALPYLTGFQPETISAKRVVTERIEFVRDGKTDASITVHLKGNGLAVLDRDGSPIAFFARGILGNGMGVYNAKGSVAVVIADMPGGGLVGVYNKDGKPTAALDTGLFGGAVCVYDNEGHILALMDAFQNHGTIELKTPSGRTVWRAP